MVVLEIRVSHQVNESDLITEEEATASNSALNQHAASIKRLAALLTHLFPSSMPKRAPPRTFFPP